MRPVKLLSVALLLAGCSSYTAKPESFILPTSNTSIDVVLHRSDVRFMDCSTLTVIQTYNASAQLIDSKEARGSAFHCVILPALVEAGGRVGASAVTPVAGGTVIKNAVSAVATQAQGQLQGQQQQQGQSSYSNNSNYNANTNANTNSNAASGGAGGGGGSGGEGGNNGGNGGHGNNGGGNGDNDGTNPGTGNGNGNGNTEGN